MPVPGGMGSWEADGESSSIMILSHVARSQLVHLKRQVRNADGSIELRPGMKHTIGRRDPHSWELGQPVTLPPELDDTQHCYVQHPGGRLLRLSYGLVLGQEVFLASNSTLVRRYATTSKASDETGDIPFVVEGIGSNPRRCLFGTASGYGNRGLEVAVSMCVEVASWKGSSLVRTELCEALPP